jgi:hypothetical protein
VVGNDRPAAPTLDVDLDVYFADGPAEVAEPRRRRPDHRRSWAPVPADRPPPAPRPPTDAVVLPAPTISEAFPRVISVPGDRLPSVLRAWWREGADDGRMVVHRRLRLGPPNVDAGIWSMRGRLRRLPCHWVPVELDLWAHSTYNTRVVLRPKRRVHASSRYFRIGHAVVDRLTEDLTRLAGAPSVRRR